MSALGENPPPETPAAETGEGVDGAVAEADGALKDAGDALASAGPAPQATEDVVAGAEALKGVVAEKSGTVAGIIEQLDNFGFTIDETRISAWSILVVIMVVLGVIVFARIFSKMAHSALSRMTRFDASQRLLAEKIATIAVWAFAILIGIDMLGIDLTALAVFSGAFGLAIGFGLQKTFGNLLAGIILLMDKSIKPGDVISVADTAGNEGFGQIRKIGIRAISVVTRDQTEYLIPNENLMINQVVNWSYSSREVRVKAPVGVSYGSDLDLVTKLLYQAVADTPRVLDNPKPRVNLMGFGNSSVDFELRFWILDPEEGLSNIRSDVFMRIWQLFKEHDVEIPFPQRDLNLRHNEQFDQLVAAIGQRVDKNS